MQTRIILAIAKKDIADAVKNAYILFALILPVGLSLFFRVLLPADGDERLQTMALVMSLVLAVCMTGVFVVPTILVEEKEKRTLQAILVSPASYLDLVIGKALVGMLYSMLLAMLLLLLNRGFAGNSAVTLLAVSLGSLFVVQVGLLMGAVFTTTTQVNTWSTIIMLALLVPAMLAMPPRPPAPVSTIVGLIPTSHMADAISMGMSNTASPSSAILDLLILAAATAIVTAALVWALRRDRR
jgi:ABC-2 type transport system permease protein